VRSTKDFNKLDDQSGLNPDWFDRDIRWNGIATIKKRKYSSVSSRPIEKMSARGTL